MKIKPPVAFQGGKQRIAGKILEIMEGRCGSFDGHPFFDLCCGSGAITIEAINRKYPFSSFTMIDNSVWGDFWQSISDKIFSVEEFKLFCDAIPQKGMIKEFLEKMSKENPYGPKKLSHVYKYLLLQAGSFGGKHIWISDGKWQNASFCNYWQPTKISRRRYPVNPMKPMPQTILNRVSLIRERMSNIINGIKFDVSRLVYFPDHAII